MANKVDGHPCRKCGTTLRYPKIGRMGPCVKCTIDNKTKRLESYHAKRKSNEFNLDYRLNSFIIETRRRSKKYNIPFNLDKDFLYKIWTGVCPISGRILDLSYADKGPNPDGPSIDRIIPELGYVKGNVRFVTYHINTALSCFGDEALKQLSIDILRTTNEQ